MSLIQEYVEDNSINVHPHEIRFIREPDRGLYDAMNKAILEAQGDYLVFLNAGDKFHCSDALEKMVAGLQKSGNLDVEHPMWPAVLYGETDLVDDEGTFLRHRRLQAPETLSWRSFLNGMLVCHQSFYVRVDIAREYLYNMRYRFSADFDWCIRIMQEAEARSLALYNTHLILTDYLSEGMTTKNQRKSLFERLRIMSHHYGIIPTIAKHLWFIVRHFSLK